MEETLRVFMPYLNSTYIDGENYTQRETEHYLTRNTKKIAWDVYRRQWQKITKRKVKKILTGIKKGVFVFQ